MARLWALSSALPFSVKRSAPESFVAITNDVPPVCASCSAAVCAVPARIDNVALAPVLAM